MSGDAIEFGLGGNNKGFVAVLNDSEKKAKETGEKIRKELDKATSTTGGGKSKASTEIEGLAKQLGKVKDSGGAFDLVLSRIGAATRFTAVAAVIGTIGKAIGDASRDAREMELAMERITRKNMGGTAGRTGGELQENLATIQKAREENQKVIKGMAEGLFGENFLKAGGQALKEALAATGNSISKGLGGSGFEVSTPAEREDMLRAAEEEALARIAKKQAEIFAIEKVRLQGGKEQADLMAIEAEYAEKTQAAIALRNTDLQKQLKLEKEAKIEAVKKQQTLAVGTRSTAEANAAMAAGDARRAVGMTAEDEQRQANNSRLASAGFAEDNARFAAGATPLDLDLQSKYQVAVRETEKIASENAKWERDLARSKGDAVKSATAENEARAAQLSGQKSLGDFIRQRAANEQAIVTAQRAGNTALADQLKLTGDLERKEIARQRVMDGNRVMSSREVRNREKQDALTAKEADRAAAQMSESEGNVVATAGRSARASRTRGASYSESTRSAGAGGVTLGASTFSTEAMGRAGWDAKRESEKFELGSTSSKEMANRKKIADVGVSRAEREETEKSRLQERIASGKASSEEALATAVQILTKWDQGK